MKARKLRSHCRLASTNSSTASVGCASQQPHLRSQRPHRESLTGREAHDRLKAILAETLDEELWRALRIQQGTELMLPNFGLPSMGRALDRAAGGDLATDREETLWTRIGEEYDKYWTATGQVKGERRSSAQSVQEARDRVGELTRQLQEIESEAAQMSRLIGESIRLSETMKECEERERELDQRWNAMDRLRSEVERLNAIHSAAEAQRDGASSEWQRRQNLIATRDTSTKDLVALQAEAEDAAPGLATATRRSKDATAALKDADAAMRDAHGRLSRAIADRDYLRQLIEVDQLKERHGRYLRRSKPSSRLRRTWNRPELMTKWLTKSRKPTSRMSGLSQPLGVRLRRSR